eukprot:316637_1
MNQREADEGDALQFDCADPDLSGTGDEILSPTNSARNVIPPGVKRQFEHAREASINAFHNASSKVEQAANSEKGQKMQQDIHYGFEKIGQAVENCWNWTKEHVEPAAKEIGESTKYLIDHAFGEGKTPPPPGYTGYHESHQQQTEEQQIKNEDLFSSSSRHAQDIYSPEMPTADVLPESSSTLIQNIPDDD